jgi:predicted RecB family nuclease
VVTNRITASLLYNHLTCPHRVAMDVFADPARKDPVSPFLQLLWERGTVHEKDVIATLGQPFLDLSMLSGDEKEAATRSAIDRREPLIYNGRLSIEELLGEPDLLRWEGSGYAAIDIKSGAGEEGGDEEEGEDGKPKKTYGVQIALYTDILIRLEVSAGRYGYIWDVHGLEKRYSLDEPLGPRSPSIWESYLEARASVTRTLTGAGATRPASASVCKQCVWRSSCLKELKDCQDLTLLPELGRARRDALIGQFPALDNLALANVERFIHGKKTDFSGVGPSTLRKFRIRAELAVADKPVPFLTRLVAWPAVDAELFFDIETDPMRDVCYLHGFVIREGGRTEEERFEGIYAEDLSPAAEKAAFTAAMTIFRAYAAGLVVHYSKYERTEYRKLQRKYPDVATAEEIEDLFAPPRALDLYTDVVRPGSEWPTLDFSIKSIAKVCGFAWRDADPSGAASIEWFDQWAKTGDPALRRRLLEYNEDDCRAMRVVLDRMKTLELRQ